MFKSMKKSVIALALFSLSLSLLFAELGYGQIMTADLELQALKQEPAEHLSQKDQVNAEDLIKVIEEGVVSTNDFDEKARRLTPRALYTVLIYIKARSEKDPLTPRTAFSSAPDPTSKPSSTGMNSTYRKRFSDILAGSTYLSYMRLKFRQLSLSGQINQLTASRIFPVPSPDELEEYAALSFADFLKVFYMVRV